MEIRYEKHWSGYLNRYMEFKIYGSTGKPVLFIPCQAGRFWDFNVVIILNNINIPLGELEWKFVTLSIGAVI